jgi:hypothetical protein
MRIDIHESRDLLVSHGKEVEEILRRAVRSALLEHKRAGNPVASWEEGRVVLIEANKIPVDDPLDQEQNLTSRDQPRRQR